MWTGTVASLVPIPDEHRHWCHTDAVTTLRGRLWRSGQVISRDYPLDDLDGLLRDPSVLVWLDLEDPDRVTLDSLALELGLDPNAVEDAVEEGERVKLSRHANHLFITTYATRIATDADAPHHSRVTTSQVSVFVLPRGLITVRRGSALDIDGVASRWDDDPLLCEQGVGGLLHGLLDTIVDGHFDTIQNLDDAIQEIEDALFADDRAPKVLQESVYRMRRELVELRRIVLPMREVVASILRRRLVMAGSGGIAVALEGGPVPALDHPAATPAPPLPAALYAPIDGWYDDLYDHVLRASEWTESLRDMLASIFETNLSLQDARLNTIMKKLAGWAAIIAVPTAVTGWFGQNVPYPGFAEPFGMFQSIAAILIGSVGLYLLFRKYDWI